MLKLKQFQKKKLNISEYRLQITELTWWCFTVSPFLFLSVCLSHSVSLTVSLSVSFCITLWSNSLFLPLSPPLSFSSRSPPVFLALPLSLSLYLLPFHTLSSSVSHLYLFLSLFTILSILPLPAHSLSPMLCLSPSLCPLAPSPSFFYISLPVSLCHLSLFFPISGPISFPFFFHVLFTPSALPLPPPPLPPISSIFLSLQFLGVIISWLYITRVEDAINEYGHYMDGLLSSSAGERAAKHHGRVAKWFKCMPDIDWSNSSSSSQTGTNTHVELQCDYMLLHWKNFDFGELSFNPSVC